MQDPSDLYRLETDVDITEAQAPVLLVALDGFLDAGHVQKLVVGHLMESLDHRVVATFDVDQLLDYRGRRPPMTFERDHWSGYEDPMLALHRFVDDSGRPFLVLTGPEPDYQWERVVEAIRRLSGMLAVDTTVTMHGIPMGVPHTRPIGATVHATDPDVRAGQKPLFGTVQVPGSVAALLELRLGEEGRKAFGFAVHVPHYLAQADFPQGAVAALERLAEHTGLRIPDSGLRLAATESAKAIDSELESSAGAAEVVAALETQYDQAMGAIGPSSDLLEATGGEVPTADQLGAEFEAFLRDGGSGDAPDEG